MPNDHYVTQALTEPWQVGSHLWYFDFADRTIHPGAPSRLFAKKGLNPPEIEDLLNRVIEAPLTRFRQKLLKRGVTTTNDWQEFRALLLFPFAQAARIMHLREPEVGHLERFFNLGEQRLDLWAREVSKDFQPATLGMPSDNWLFYPEVGFFQFPVHNTNPDPRRQPPSFSTGLAVPLNPWLALVVLPKIADLARVEENRAILHDYSVGLNEGCRRVVIPGKVPRSNHERVVEEIERIRERVIRLEKLRFGHFGLEELWQDVLPAFLEI